MSERCLQYWDKTRILSPSESVDGAGLYRGYTRTDVIIASIVNKLREAGVSLQHIRKKCIRTIRRTVRQAEDQGLDPRVGKQKGHVLILMRGTAGAGQTQAIVDALRDGQLVLAIDYEPIQNELDQKLREPKWRKRTRRAKTEPPAAPALASTGRRSYRNTERID